MGCMAADAHPGSAALRDQGIKAMDRVVHLESTHARIQEYELGGHGFIS